LGVTRCASAKNLGLRMDCSPRADGKREKNCKTRYGSCPRAALGWGVGRGHGWQYLDRLGGAPGQIASCAKNEYLKGIGVRRCAGAKNLQLSMRCCDV